jgi:hypothetical protein
MRNASHELEPRFGDHMRDSQSWFPNRAPTRAFGMTGCCRGKIALQFLFPNLLGKCRRRRRRGVSASSNLTFETGGPYLHQYPIGAVRHFPTRAAQGREVFSLHSHNRHSGDLAPPKHSRATPKSSTLREGEKSEPTENTDSTRWNRVVENWLPSRAPAFRETLGRDDGCFILSAYGCLLRFVHWHLDLA